MNTNNLHRPPETELAAELRKRQAAVLIEQLPVTVGANLVLGLLTALAFYGVAPDAMLLVWIVLLAGSFIPGIRAWIRYRRGQWTLAGRRFGRRVFINAVLTAAPWGLGAIMLYPYGVSTERSIFVFVVAGVAAGSIASLSTVPTASIGYVLTAVSPLILAVLRYSSWRDGLVMSVMLVLFVAYLLFHQRRAWRDFRNKTASDLENVRLLEALRRAKTELEESGRAKARFLASVSHELRTPMNAVLGYAELLEADPGLDEDRRDSVREIVVGGRRLRETIDSILGFVATDDGETTGVGEAVRLSDIARHAVSAERRVADAKTVSFELDPKLEGATVRANAKGLQRAVDNLVSNAVKFNRSGGRVRIDAAWLPGATWRFRVADDGAGIPRDRLDRLFVPFERLGIEAGTTRGLGVGLALARRLVEGMGGKIGAESVEGSGSVFWIELPAADPGA